MMGRKWLLVCWVLSLTVLSINALAADPNMITAASRVSGTRIAPEVVNGGLVDGCVSFVDRDYGPAIVGDLEGIDYVKTSMDGRDKSTEDTWYQVTVDKPGRLFVIIDNRVGDGVDTDPPDLTNKMTWVVTDGFVRTTYEIPSGWGAGEECTIYEKAVTAGTYIFKEQNDGTGRAAYGIAAAPDGWVFPNVSPLILGVAAWYQVPPGGSLEIDAGTWDDGLPSPPAATTVQWTVESQPAGTTVTFDPPSMDTTSVTVDFSELGEYTLKLAVSDSNMVAEQLIDVAVQVPAFAVEAGDWCDVSNDSNAGPDKSRKSSAIYVKNYDQDSVQRRRVGYCQYDISGLREAGEVFANSYFTWNMDKGDNYSSYQVYVYAINEDIDDLTLEGLTWNTAPGIDNTPVPPLNSQITIDTLDRADITPLLGASNVNASDAWENTEVFAGLDEVLNADTDGILTLMFIAYDPAHNAYELCSPSKGRIEPITGLEGIILRGNVTTPTWATQPVPVINTSQSTSLPELSWTNPPAEGTLTCDVWIGTGEPNKVTVGSGDGFTQIADDVTGNTASLSGYTLAIDTVYNWVVVVTDSGTGETTQGFKWTFDTFNAYPTVTIDEPYQYLWLNNNGDANSATAVITATVSDDDFPNPTLDLLWEQISGPATVLIDPNDVKDVTLVLPAEGTYVFQLSADDGDLIGNGIAEILVAASPCDAAKAKPDYEATVGDLNADCYVNLDDFSMFALQWLVCNPSMDAPCTP